MGLDKKVLESEHGDLSLNSLKNNIRFGLTASSLIGIGALYIAYETYKSYIGPNHEPLMPSTLAVGFLWTGILSTIIFKGAIEDIKAYEYFKNHYSE